MIQSFLFLLAPTQAYAEDPGKTLRPFVQMATRNYSPETKQWKKQVKTALNITANSVGFILFLAGLGLALRLMEVLLH